MNQQPVLRRCVACRGVFDRRRLIKVTRDFKDGVVLEGGMGRSAYICLNQSCLDESWRRKRLQKALRCKVEQNIIEILKDRLNQCNDPSTRAR